MALGYLTGFVSFMTGLLSSSILLSVIAALVLSPLLKGIVRSVQQGRLDFSRSLSTGGMPSSHAALVSSLAAAVYLQEGMSSLFVFSLIFALFVIFDSLTLRQTVSRQTDMLKEIAKSSKLRQGWDFKGVMGHTSFQAFMGVLLGIAISMIVFYLRTL